MRRTFPEKSGQAGFTLIEALVALAIVTVVLAAIGSLYAANVRSVVALERHTAFIETARVIVSSLTDAPALDEDLGGETLGYQWQAHRSVLDTDEVPGTRFVPDLVEVRVRAPSGAIRSYETVQLRDRSTSR